MPSHRAHAFRLRAARAVVLATLLVVAGACATSARPARAGRAAAAALHKWPWVVYPGDPATMLVLWQPWVSETDTLEWGPDSATVSGQLASEETGSDHLHVATIAGLPPGAACTYRVRAAGLVRGGTFRAAPPPESRHVAFFAYGDTRSDPASDDSVAAAMNAVMVSDPAWRTMALFMGDFTSDGGDAATWDAEFFDPVFTHLRAFAADVPLETCVGNHDVAEPSLLARYFPYDWVGAHFGSFDYGPAHVAVLDQYVDIGPGSPQLAWLAADLASSRQPWKFVVMHEPGWSAWGDHHDDPNVQHAIEPICERFGVAMVLAGHNHYYARARVNGVVHITTGGGGAPLVTPLPGQDSVLVTRRAHHYCAIAIDGDTLRCRAVTPTGAVLDSFTLVRRPAGPAAAAPVTAPRPGRGGQRLGPPTPDPRHDAPGAPGPR